MKKENRVTNETIYKEVLGEEKYFSAYIALSPRPLYPIYYLDLYNWCRDYDKNNKFPNNDLNTFIIGFYQIHQGMEWRDNGVNKYESYAASIIHFTRILTRYQKFNCENFFHIRLKDGEASNELYYKGVLHSCSKAAQQLMYASKVNKVKTRKSRYNEETMLFHVRQATIELMKAIPKQHRREAFEASTTILTKELK